MGTQVQPPHVEGPPSTGRHHAQPAAAPGRLATFSAHPPRLLRWAMLGAALVILIAVPLMNLPGRTPSGTVTTADQRDDAEPNRPAASAAATGSIGTALSEPSVTSAAQTADGSLDAASTVVPGDPAAPAATPG